MRPVGRVGCHYQRHRAVQNNDNYSGMAWKEFAERERASGFCLFLTRDYGTDMVWWCSGL